MRRNSWSISFNSKKNPQYLFRMEQHYVKQRIYLTYYRTHDIKNRTTTTS